MKKRKIFLSISSAVMIFALIVPMIFSVSGVDAETVEMSESKISDQLKSEMAKLSEKEKITVYVWYKDIDYAKVESNALQKNSVTLDKIEAEENKIKEIDSAILMDDSSESVAKTKAYLAETKNEREKVQNMVDTYITARRESAKQLYVSQNTANERILGLTDDEIIYSSQYSPMTIAHITATDIAKLAKDNTVKYIDFRGDFKKGESLSYAMPAIDDDYVRNTQGFDGYGVKVGIIEWGRVGTHSDLSSTNITRLDPTKPVNSHATIVARVFVGKNGPAKNATVYTISPDEASSFQTVLFESALEKLISYGVSVINMSISVSRGNSVYYDAIDKWVDHITYQHNVSVVFAAGNNGTSSVIWQPGLAYNVITVGGMQTNGTVTKNDDTFYTDTSTANGGTAGCAKPDFLAPADVIGYIGTSLAAPMVSGVIAQMIEYKPSIATKPELIKAILTSSCTKKFPAQTNETMEQGLTAKEGSGQINAKFAIWALASGRYQTGTISSGSITRNISVTSSDIWINSSVAWLRGSTVGSNHTGATPTVQTHANLKLEVYKPNGTLLKSSNIPTSSVEMVYFSVGSTYGTYKLKISRMDSGTNSVRYALVWC